MALTEEERKQHKRESQKRYREAHKDYYNNYNKQYYLEHKNEILFEKKKYYTENKDDILEYKTKYYKANKESKTNYNKLYYIDNIEILKKKYYQYYRTKYGRALILLSGYMRSDKKSNRGECTLTAEWIIENIFSGQICTYCGESDWMNLGCDRKDSSLPHTPDNCVPCCQLCNSKKGTMSYEEYMKKVGN